MKVIWSITLFVWLIGAFSYGIYDNFNRKKSCIENEGFLKGWLWCSQETTHTFSISMLKGLAWPYFLVISAEDSKNKTNYSLKDLANSRVYTAYICWSAATMLDNNDGSNTFSKLIEYFRSIDKQTDIDHPYFLERSVLEVIQFGSKESLENYYLTQCSEPASRIQLAFKQGVFK